MLFRPYSCSCHCLMLTFVILFELALCVCVLTRSSTWPHHGKLSHVLPCSVFDARRCCPVEPGRTWPNAPRNSVGHRVGCGPACLWLDAAQMLSQAARVACCCVPAEGRHSLADT